MSTLKFSSLGLACVVLISMAAEANSQTELPYAESTLQEASTSLAGAGTAPIVLDPSENVVSIAKSQSRQQPAAPRDIQDVPQTVMQNLAPPAAPIETNQTIVVKPGVNTLIPISISQPNRIITPFGRPVVKTLSTATIDVSQNVIYISPKDKNPVALYITEKGDESAAISLSLLPQKIPPMQANLVISTPLSEGVTGMEGSTAFTAKAKQFEQSQPYMDTIKIIMRSLALGEIPQGFSISKLHPGYAIPSCHLPGFEFDFSKAQLIKGHDYNAIVATVRNVSGRTLQFDEMACTHPLLAATAVWPKNVLEPGERTELYVATRSANTIVRAAKRPSLLD
ncbi:type-F conjugative transfer system secretin TraK [Pseudomonas putida]|nr:type-F conjugative transfer system secretin TraK [Pseudomonas putida]